MKKAILLFLLTVCSFRLSENAPTQDEHRAAEAKRYKLKGKVVSVDKAKKTAKIDARRDSGLYEGDDDEISRSAPIGSGKI